jgi:putative Mg2+ transporter-C (MgtC) family protein
MRLKPCAPLRASLLMPLSLTWQDTAFRLILTLAVGAILGFNRGSRGHAAGLRTTILVALAASVAMIQMNLLLVVDGKTSSSFSVMDIMRLPLGILTGVGFIGGGTILKRGDLVTGVTTAATLWMATVIGLCLGGGQLDLGIGATVLSALVLWPLKWLDVRIPRRQKATVTLALREGANRSPPDLGPLLGPLRCEADFGRRVSTAVGRDQFMFELSWKQSEFGRCPQCAPPRARRPV